MIRPESFGEQLVDQIVGGVLDHLDLLEHDLLFLFDLDGVKGWMRDQIGENVHRHRQVLVEHLHVIAGILLRSEGIELPANRVHFLGDAFGGPPIGALEQHVLDEVRDAGVCGGFVARPSRQPHADAH
jgi:hypothetical protein